MKMSIYGRERRKKKVDINFRYLYKYIILKDTVDIISSDPP